MDSFSLIPTDAGFLAYMTLAVMFSTQVIKKYVPKKYRAALAVLIGAVADILVVLPIDLVTTIESVVGGGLIGFFATGAYKLLDNFSPNEKSIVHPDGSFGHSNLEPNSSFNDNK